MRYLLAILLPPLAVFACGKPFQGLINIILTIAGIIPGLIHALFVVHKYYSDQRHQEMLNALKQG